MKYTYINTNKKLFYSLLSFIVAFSLILSAASSALFIAKADETIEKWNGTAATSFAGGKGTVDDPYQIENGGQLYKMVSDYSDVAASTDAEHTYFEIISDIDLNNQPWYRFANADNNSLNGKYPVLDKSTNATKGFNGIIEGNGHTIYNLYRTGGGTSAVGLIPVATQGAEIHNLNLYTGTISAGISSSACSALIGVAVGSDSSVPIVIDRCSVTGFSIEGNSGVGGMVGRVIRQALNITNCYLNTTVLTHTSNADIGQFIGAIDKTGMNNKINISNSYCVGRPVRQVGSAQTYSYTNVYVADFDVTDLTYNTGLTTLTAAQMTGEAAKKNMTGFDFETVWQTNENGYPTLIKKVEETTECTHAETDDAIIEEPTYFKAGSKNVVCADCNEIVNKGVALDRVTANAITFTPSYSGSKLTIKWVYSDELSIDIDKAIENANDVKLNIACTIGDEVVKNLPDFAATNDSGEIEIDGFNVARLDKTVALDLTFDFGGAYDTDLVAELNNTAKYTVVAKDIADESTDSTELSALIEAIGERESIVVNGNNTSCADFDVAYSKVDIVNATAEFKFTATDAFINAVKANSNYNDGRTVNLVVNIGGKDYPVKIDSLKTNITVKISGLSFSQMYGDITAKLVITYADDSVGAIETDNITVSFDDAIAASEDPAAVALKALMNK